MKNKEIIIFKRLEYGFWVLWLISPFLLSMAIYYIWFVYPYEVPAAGASASAMVTSFSALGQALVALELAVNAGFYIGMVALMHSLVRRFARGEMLLSATLSTMQRIAWLFLVYGIIGTPLYNGVMYLLHQLGDLQEWDPSFFIDVLSIAIALMMFALRVLIAHAITIKEDHDLTV